LGESSKTTSPLFKAASATLTFSRLPDGIVTSS
jgi:hypothetical protein